MLKGSITVKVTTTIILVYSSRFFLGGDEGMGLAV